MPAISIFLNSKLNGKIYMWELLNLILGKENVLLYLERMDYEIKSNNLHLY